MDQLFATFSTSITELKKNPSAVIEAAGDEAVAILNHNRPTAYIVPAKVYEALIEALDDHYLGLLVRERESERDKAIEVSLDEL
ncbi:MAG: type II toxin-antitoxin system Phd/YefM family antitoxin [Candidatus Dadabacteria bacterium]|nr:MAG: type II toxin-antitoxin system Phd/YefM family antitoxin [Candidatus Dadabacteria bacterium]